MSVAQAAAILRPRRGTAHGGAEGIWDPGPMLTRLRYATRTGGWANNHGGLLGMGAGARERPGPV